jgi:hypothetical protein
LDYKIFIIILTIKTKNKLKFIMKQFIILAALVTFLTSCGGTMTETTPVTDSVAVDTTKVDTTACCKDSVKTDTAK